MFTHGERVPLLIDTISGLPHWYATLFITTQARNSSKAPNTMIAMLSAIRTLLAWAESQGISLDARFSSLRVLEEHEIESLRAYAQSRHRPGDIAASEARSIPRRAESARIHLHTTVSRISSGTHYIRLTYMADYLDWFGVQMTAYKPLGLRAAAQSRISGMTQGLRSRRPQKITPSRLSARKGLSRESQTLLLNLVKPGTASNPFKEPSIQQRNEIIVLLLYHLGVRSGELLAMKVSDFDFQMNDVVIPRRHGDPSDPRRNQPVAKTLDRRIPLAHSLSTAVSNYVLISRRLFPQAKRHAFLLVTHQPGPYQGSPLSIKGLTKTIATLQRTDPKRLPQST